MKKFKGAGRPSTVPSRSNTTSSIRGKISAPIPLTTADDELSVRASGTGIVMPLVGEESLEREPRAAPIPLQQEAVKPEESNMPVVLEEAPSRAVTSEPLSATASYESPTPQATQVTPVRGSGSSNPSESRLDKPQRKKSTLRSVLGRLFGKKRKSGASTKGLQEASPRAGQHRSDPSALRKPSGQTITPKRSASMPINDFNRALRSHSPFGEDQKAKGRSNIRDSGDLEPPVRPRRSTTLSRLYEPTRTPGYMSWVGLSPRPASSHARDSVAFTGVDSEEPIGYAITSGSHPNRRSRSLGHVRDLASQHDVRRRSDEIRYWRESYPSYDPDAMSPISSQHRTENEFRPITQEGETSQEEEPREAPQPFNFGPLGDLAGMKITQAASLDSRVSTLEARLDRVERAMANIQDRISVSTLPLRDYSTRPTTDSSERSLQKIDTNQIHQQAQNFQASSSYRTENQSYESSRPSTTSTQPSKNQSYEELSPRPVYLSSQEPTPTAEIPLSRNALSARHSESMARPLSTSTTIRGVTSSSPSRTADRTLSLSKNGSLTAHHYSALLNLITAEQSARQTLEVQVASLQQQLQSLLSRPGERGSVIYPTPRSVPAPSRQTMGRGEFSTFEHEESGTESEDDNYGGSRDDVFQTPLEERETYADYDEYGDELAEMEERGESRTMSLSQLTMGKPDVNIIRF